MRYRLVAALLGLILTATATADPVVLDADTRDLSEAAHDADRSGLPIMLLISGEDCGYCKLLKREVLYPMLRNGELQERLIVREMKRKSGGKIIGFDGEKVRTRLLLDHYHVFATPTVLFLDPDGRPLHDPLVGFNGAERYRPLLEQAIGESTTMLREVGRAKSGQMAGSP